MRKAAFVLAGMLALAAFPAFAQAPALTPGTLNSIVDTFSAAAAAWEGSLSAIARDLFAKLAAIEFAWVVGRAVARRVDFADLLEIIAMQIISIGFWLFLLINSADFVLAIIASFGEAANQAVTAAGGSANLSPSQIFEAGVNMVRTIWNAISITSPGLSILLVIAGFINLYVFSVVTGKMIEVLVESYFCAYAGIVFMGFGGSSYTRDYAAAQFRYGISVGAKRFVLQLIVGLGQGIIIGWANVAQSAALTGASPDWKGLAVMVGAPIVMLRLVESLPNRSQDMINGAVSPSHGSIGATAAATAATAAGIAASLAGGGAATKAAFQLASRQIEDRAKSSGQQPSAAARAAMTVGYTARNLGSAYSADVGKRLTGQHSARHGRTSFRMAETMKKDKGKSKP